jgi:DNA-directed RNA polymerase subunit RPC12/RpoP
MIHLRCAKCHSKLAVQDALAGRLAACPKCHSKLRIPSPETAEEEEAPEDRISAAPKRESYSQSRRTRQPVEEEDEEDRPRRRIEEDDEEDERPVRSRRRPIEEAEVPAEDDEPRPRPRKKRRKRRRPRETSDFLANVNWFLVGLGGLAFIWIVSLGLAFAFPPFALVPMGLGWLLSMVGGVWFLIIAFQDDVTAGILCLLVPFYSVYYLITNFDSVKMPFFAQMLGLVMIMSSTCVAGRGFSDSRVEIQPGYLHGEYRLVSQVGRPISGKA